MFKQNILPLFDKYLGVPTTTSLYHYTTIEALVNGIIRENALVCIRATHYKFLNDPSELHNGIIFSADLLSKIRPEKSKKEYIELFYKRLSDVFMISFSRNPNSLPMWNTYGNQGNGVAIEFQNLISTSETSLLLRCWYDPNKEYEILEQNLPEELLKRLTVPILISAPLIFKNADYNYEKEVRFIGQFVNLPVHYRVKNGYIIPFKEIYFSQDHIKSITLGPCVNQDGIKESLRSFLDNRGLDNVIIKESRTPYRNL